jgi:methylthioribulose 1-phosphate dehydratase/enolase-phosphatase E1
MKGVGHHGYDDVLEIPIIDNRPSEDLLADQLEHVINAYPNTNAVLVRRHGLYVWGDSWEQAKTQCEAFDYLFQSVIEMTRLGIDPGAKPMHGTYRVDEMKEPDAKRQKIGFHGLEKYDNADDLASNTIPILPRDGKHLLLDIEGCTTSISFVKDVLFPYVLANLDEYLKQLQTAEYNALGQALLDDLTDAQKLQISDLNDCAVVVKYMVENDLKIQSLKAMQGRMWRAGYEKGDLKGHVFPDLVPMLHWMQNHGVKVYIYSSGSIEAQKLLFGYSEQGDLEELIQGHFDISTSGSKIDSASYERIACSLGIPAGEIVFCSDSEAELYAARAGGIGSTIMTVRPGNVPRTPQGVKDFPQVFSLLQLCGM